MSNSTIPKFSNNEGINLSLAVFLVTDSYDYSDDPTEISATALLRPLKQIVLGSRVPPIDSTVDISGMVANRLGASIHDGIEKAWKGNYKQAMAMLGYPQNVIDRVVINPDPNNLPEDCLPVYLEQRFKRKLGNYTITGKVDIIVDGELEDFKTMKAMNYMLSDGKKFAQQGSIYRWLVPDVITSSSMTIQHIILDWTQGMTLSNPNYPPNQIMPKKYQLADPAITEAFIMKKLQDIKHYSQLPEEDIPPCNDEELWRKPTVWKYFAKAENARSTKNFESQYEAYSYMAEKGNKGVVREAKGEVVACRYCPAFSVCKQKDQYISEGLLKI